MRDSRVSFFSGTPNLTINSATTTNGSTIDLKSGYVGDYFEGAPVKYGIGVELMFSSITSTNNNVVLRWEVSDDDSTWLVDQEILNGELSALKTSAGTKVVVPTRLRTPRRYCRLVIVTSGMAGSSFVVNAWLSDGTTDQGYGESYLRK